MLLVLLACSAIDDLTAKVEGLTNTLVMEGLYVGVEPPESDLVDLSGTDFDKGAFATALLADAASVDDLANAPVSGADVTLRSEAHGDTPLGDDGNGKYTATGDDGLAYADGDPVVLAVSLDGEHRASIVAPPAVDANISPQHDAGQPLAISAGDPNLATLFVVVANAETGTLTYDNRPTSIEDVYNLSHGDGTLAVEVPGSAFPDQTLYIVGVAGMNLTPADGFTELNTLLSAFLAGKFTFYPVSTLPTP